MDNLKTRAFSLVELLAVVGVIVALAAILFPVMHSAKTAGETTVMVSNLRQLAVAANLYKLDYELDAIEVVSIDRMIEARYVLRAITNTSLDLTKDGAVCDYFAKSGMGTQFTCAGRRSVFSFADFDHVPDDAHRLRLEALKAWAGFVLGPNTGIFEQSTFESRPFGMNVNHEGAVRKVAVYFLEESNFQNGGYGTRLELGNLFDK